MSRKNSILKVIFFDLSDVIWYHIIYRSHEWNVNRYWKMSVCKCGGLLWMYFVCSSTGIYWFSFFLQGKNMFTIQLMIRLQILWFFSHSSPSCGGFSYKCELCLLDVRLHLIWPHIALCGYPLVKMELEIQTRFLPRLQFSSNSIISDKIWRKMSLSLSNCLVLPQISLVKYYETIKILMQIFWYFRSHFHNVEGPG